MHTSTRNFFSLFLLTTLAIGLSSLASFGQTITGTVYRDFNSDGVYTSIPGSATYTYGEPGVSGVTVTAYNAAGVAVATTTTSSLTASLGSYTLTVGNTNAYRVEFTNLTTGDYEAFRGTGSATSVQFVVGGATGVNLGINYPLDYCQTNPEVVIPCYVNGDPLSTSAVSPQAGTQGVLVTLPYASTGDTPAEAAIALNSQVGTVYGVAYQRASKSIFTSAFVKRHSGLGNGGPGAIYITKPGSGTTYTSALFATIPFAATAVSASGSTTVASNSARGLPALTTAQNYDPITFDQVGKAGLGDLEVSDDGTTLYVVNLGDRKLYQVPINNPTSANPTAGTPVGITIPTPTQTTGSQFRPFGLKYYRDRVYIGGVTTNEAVSTTATFGIGPSGSSALITRDTTGMKAFVYEYNPTTGTFITVLSFPLTYKKGASDNDQVGSYRADRWLPWTDVVPATGQLPNRFARNDLPNASYPQPWLTGIEFDTDGSMIISIRDRMGDQFGNNNYGTASPSTQQYRAISPGDILRAGKCNPAVDLWTIENNARVCGGLPTAGANNGEGIGGGEYYYQDAVAIGNPYHNEMSLGGLALLAGTGDVTSSVMDPTDNIDSGGLRRFKNNGTGSSATSAQIYVSSNVATFGKANGLGDVELECNQAPVEVGNRVWLDANNNGIQDPGELPLAGVSVNLKGPGLVAAGVTVVTNALGEYYFSNATTGTATTSYANNLSLTSGSSYTLTFPTSVTTSNSVLSTKPNSATGTNSDNIDTDPTAAGLVVFTVGAAGHNNFSYDAGYFPCTPPSLTALANNSTSTSICVGTPVTLTVQVQVTPADSYTYAWSAPAGVTLTGASTATATATGLPTGTTTFTVTVSTSPICSTFTTVSVVVNPLPTPAFTSSTICVGQTATLTATGGTSYTFSNGTTNNTGSLVVSPTSTTAYSVTVANASGCRSTTTATVTVNALPVAELSSASICAGQSVTLTATGGTSYTFSNGTTNTTGLLVVNPTVPTTYTVTVANASGCRSTTTGTVSINPPPTPALTPATICVGQTATLTATGGTSYTFSNGITNTTGVITVSPTSTTAYSVTVANASGCFSTTTATVTVNPLPTATLATVPPASATICAGQSTTLTATGGTSYVFSDGTSNTTGVIVVSPTSTTAYSVTATNANGCSNTASRPITVNPLPTPTFTSTTICVGQGATLTATGGTSYTFSNGIINTTGVLGVNPTTTTTYSVTVANASGCVNTATATLTVNPLPVATLTPTAICVGQTGTITATGGTSYTFSNGTINNTGVLMVSPATTTTYSVTVANASGCISTTSATVTVNTLPTANLTPTAICAGQTGTITATGGTSYTFSTGLVNTTGVMMISPASTRIYSVTVANDNGCRSSANATVTVNPLPAADLTPATICVGQTATITATGGTSYTFSNGTINTTGVLGVNPTTTTIYSVTVANASGCISTTSATVTVNPLPTATLTPATICIGQTATITATGGASYIFSNGTTNTTGVITVSPTITTTYSVTAANASNCFSTTTATVTVNPLPTADLTPAIICAGQSATLTATGGTSYTFSNGTINTRGILVVSPAATTTYSVTVANASGCRSTTTATVTVNPLPAAALTPTTICIGQTGTITATGGTSYTFSNGTINTTGVLMVSPAATTTYSVTVANDNNCISTATATVTVNPLPTADLTSTTICAGQTGTITATGGTLYIFSNGTTNGTGILTVSPVATTTYSVTVANGSNCFSTASATVTVNPLPTAALTSATVCIGQSITITATGGTSYTFSNGTLNTRGNLVVSPGTTTTYSVTVANANGCVNTATGTVTVNPLPTATLTPATICVGQTATLTATGGTSYTFSTGEVNTTGTLAVTPTTTNIYSVTVANASGCRSTTTATVTVNPLPTAALTPITICAGQAGTITATGGTSYTFSDGTTNTTGLLSVSPTITTDYSVTVANASGCTSTTTATVTVNPLPTAALTSTTICIGQTATLTATGGTSYTFSNGTINTTGILGVQPTTTTTYSVTVANASGCRSTTTATVTVNPLPIAALTSATICVGQTATITATGGTNYTFSDGTTNTTGTLTVSPLTTTVYSITVASSSGCISTTTATVTLNPLPIASLTSATICIDQTATLTATGGTSYVFSDGTSNTTGVLAVSPEVTTTYSVTVANASGCISTTTATVTVNPLPTLATSVVCNGIATYNVSFTATPGAVVTANFGTVSANQVTGIPSGQTVILTTTLNGCSINTSITQNCLSNEASLGDYVFNDVNKDGIQNTGDLPLAGVTAVLYINGVASATTVTSSTGFYSFTGLTPGNSLSYSVGFTTPTGFTATLTNQTSDETLDSDADPITGLTQSITLANGENNPTLDAGFYVPTASLGDYVFNDTNKNGIQDAGDTPIAGVTAVLYINGVASATTVTNSTGFYSFTGLTPGSSLSYSVGFTAPTGLTATLANQGADDALDSDADSITGRTQSITLINGEFNQTLDAGFYVPTASLGDFVFNDANKNGIQDAGDTPLAGVTVVLYINGVASATTVTSATGAYSFTGLTPGSSLSYSVGFTTPAGLTATLAHQGGNGALDSDADPITGRTQSITLINGEFNQNLDAGFYVPTAGLGDYVFLDANKDGIQNTGDTPLAGVTAILYINGVASATTVTSATGAYSFTGLTPGSSLSYSVGFTAPAGYTATLAHQGANGAVDSDTDPITGRTQSVTLVNGEFNPTLDAGFYIPSASLGDFVFVDANKDGIQQPGEAGIPGVIVVLLNSSNTAIASTTTNASGSYNFTGLTPGVPYSVSFVTPTGYTSTSALIGGDDTKDSDANPITGQTRSVTLAPGENNTNLDAGFYVPTAGLGDYVFFDANKDGIQNTGDTPLAGVTAVLYINGVASATTVTSATGAYSFTGLTPGSSLSYSVGFTAPAGYTATLANQGADDALDSDADPITGRTQSVTLVNGEFNPTLDAGFYIPSAGLGDYVFNDANKNGIQDAGDTPLAGVTVVLYINGVASATTVTSSTGAYSFTGLTPGSSTSYSVGFSVPAGYTATLAHQGANPAVDSDADPITGRTQSVTLGNGEFNSALDAGFYVPTAGLGDYVFLDANKDGIQNTGDTPLAGVTAVLYINGVASSTTVTSSTGAYSFTGLTPGSSLSYSVGFTAPAGYTATLANQGADDALDSDADPITGRTQSVTLGNGEFNPTLDAGFYPQSAGLGGYVFTDTNKDGLQNPGDTPLAGVTVVLYINGVPSATVVTGSTGLYSFTGLTPGSSLSYSVGFTPPAGYTATLAHQGTGGQPDSDADPITGRTQSVTLANGQFTTQTPLDAGFILPSASLGDYVFFDANKDGIQNTGDTPLAGVTAVLYINGVASATTVTSSTGFYSFTGLTPGSSLSYSVGFTAPAGYTATLAHQGANGAVDSDADPITGRTQSVTLINGEFNQTLDAGFYIPSAGIGDYVFNDTNKNGIQDAGDTPLADVTVVLSINGVASATTVSSATGAYSFTGLTPGSSLSYSVSFTPPAGYTATLAHQGTNPAVDSDVDPVTGQTQSVTLGNGEFNSTVDAGFYIPSANLTIAKYVDKSKAAIGDVLTYTLVLSNAGPATATNVVVRDSTTTGLTYLNSSAPAGTTFTQGTPVSTWTVGSLTPGKSLSLTFQARVDSSGILYNVASIPGETVKVCTTIPYRVCAGDNFLFRLTAPTGRSSYTWYKDNIIIPGQTTNVLDVVAAGTYSLAVDNTTTGSCPDFSCCPFIVEADSLPTFQAKAVPVTCVGNTLQVNGQIVLSNFDASYTYQYSAGATFNAAASLSGLAKAIPAGGIITNTLSNPPVGQAYTIRVYNASGCFTDLTVLLTPTVCGCPAEICTPFVINQTKRGVRKIDVR